MTVSFKELIYTLLDPVPKLTRDNYTLDIYKVLRTLTGVTPASHAASHQHGGTDEVATSTPAANAIPKADSIGNLGAWIKNLPALTYTTVSDGTSETLTDIQFNYYCNASTNCNITIPDGLTGGNMYFITNVGAGTVTVSTSGSQVFIDSEASKIVEPYGHAILYSPSPGVWCMMFSINTRKSCEIKTIYPPSTGDKTLTFTTRESASRFAATLHNGSSFIIGTLGSWGYSGVFTEELAVAPGSWSVGHTIDGFINIHPINYPPNDAATFANFYIADGIAGQVTGKWHTQRGTGGSYERKVLADIDYAVTPVDGNLPEWTGTGGEMRDSLIPTSRLDQYKAGIVGANLTADVNDFTVAGLADTTMLLLDANADGWKVGGIQTGAVARRLTIFNPSAFYFYLEHAGAGSSAGNLIYTYTGLNYMVGPGRSVTLAYDDSATAWRIVGEVGTAIPLSGTGSPVGVVTARWLGDSYWQTDSTPEPACYKWNGTAWRQIDLMAATPPVEDMG